MNKTDLEDVLILRDLIVRLCNDPSNWVDFSFGANENKLYIDGCIEYKDDHEREVIEKILKERKKLNDKEER